MDGERLRETAIAFALQEHSDLRAEIRDLLKEARELERNTVAATAIVWAFLATHTEIKARWPWWIPLAFVAFGSYRAGAMHTIFRQYAQYLVGIEKMLTERSDVTGWENFLDREPRAWAAPSILFWATMLMVTVVFPWLFKSV